jgi:hypothetical protein
MTIRSRNAAERREPALERDTYLASEAIRPKWYTTA